MTRLIVDIKIDYADFSADIKFETSSKHIAILGHSGSGKSLTLRSIAGIVTPSDGKIILGDTILFDKSKNINLKIEERKIGYLFQNYALFPNMGVYDNISFGLNKKHDTKKVLSLIEKFHLQNCLNKNIKKLSGGEQQRTALARALAIDPSMLLLDEPFSALDSHLKNIVKEELKQNLKDFDISSIFVTHSVEEAYELSREIVILNKGSVVETGLSKEVLIKPKTLHTAKLCGYNNISSFKKINDATIFVDEYNLKLDVNPFDINNKTHVCLPEKKIAISDEKIDFKNSIKGTISFKKDSITSKTLLFNNSLLIEIDKHSNTKFTQSETQKYISIDKNDLFFL